MCNWSSPAYMTVSVRPTHLAKRHPVSSDAAGARQRRGCSASVIAAAHRSGNHTDHAHSVWRTGQAHDGRRTLAIAHAAGEQPVGPPQRPGPDLVFHLIVIDGHDPILAVARQRLPPLEAWVNRGCCLPVLRGCPGISAPVSLSRHRYC